MTKSVLFIIGIVLFATFAVIPPLHAQTSDQFFVNSPLDTPDANIGDGICADASGQCTLRAAIEESNRQQYITAIILPAITIVLEDNLVWIDSNVSIIGNGPDQTIINANGFNAFGYRNTSVQNYVDREISGLIVKNAITGMNIQRPGALTIDNVRLLRNSTGIRSSFTAGILTIRYSVISNNQINGARLSSNAIITNSLISNNGNGQEPGGGIYTTRNLSVHNSAIVNNIGATGGGIYHDGNRYSFNISNITISGNSAFSGGGIFTSGIPSLNNVTITDNHSTVEGAGGVVSEEPLEISNSIIYGNQAPQGINADYNGEITSLGNNILGDITDVAGLLETDQYQVNPLLAPLSFDLSTPIHKLNAGSPAIDSGNLDLCETTDQFGTQRIGSCDIGAYETPLSTDAEIAVSLSASSTQLLTGESTTITATVENWGPANAQNVQVAVNIPESMTIQNAPLPNVVDGVWTIPSLSANQSVDLVINLMPDSTTFLHELSVAYIDSDTVNLYVFNDRDELDIIVDSTDLVLNSSLNVDELFINTPFTYTINATNEGLTPITGTEIVIDLPPSAEVTNFVGDGYADEVWTLNGSLANGETRELVLEITLNNDYAIHGTVEFNAMASTLDQYDTVFYNNETTDTALLDIANVILRLQETHPRAFFEGQEIQLSVEVELTERALINDFKFELTIPEHITLVSFDNDLRLIDGYLVFPEPLYRHHSVREIFDFVFRVDAIPALPANDVLRIDALNPYYDPSGFNNSIVLSVPYAYPVDLALHNQVDSTVQLGDTVTHTLILSNQNVHEATNIVVYSQPIYNHQYLSHSGDGTYDPNSNLWTIPAIAAGEQMTLEIETQVNSGSNRFTQIAQIQSMDQIDIDSIPGNSRVDEDDYTQAEALICASATPIVYDIADNDETALVNALNTIRGTSCIDGEAVINLAPEGTYSITVSGSNRPETILPTIRNRVRINGNGAHLEMSGARAFYIEQYGELTLENLTLEQGNTSNQEGRQIYNQGILRLNNVTIGGQINVSSHQDHSNIYSEGDIYMDRSLVEFTFTSDTRFMEVVDGRAEITNSIFEANEEMNLRLFILSNLRGDLTLTNNMFLVPSPNFIESDSSIVRATGNILNYINFYNTECETNFTIISGGYNIFDATPACNHIVAQPTDQFTSSLITQSRRNYIGYRYDAGAFDDPIIEVISDATMVDQIPPALCPSVDYNGTNRALDGDGDGTPLCDVGPYEYATEPGMDVAVSFDNATPNAGDIYNMTLTVTNSGTATYENLQLLVSVPEHFELVWQEIPEYVYEAQWLFVLDADAILWKFNNAFASGDNRTISLPIRSRHSLNGGTASISTAGYAEPMLQQHLFTTATPPMDCETNVNWTVDAGDEFELIRAIERANDENCHPGANTITLNGAVQLTNSYYIEDNETVLPTITSDITIIGGELQLPAGSNDRFFRITENASLTLNGVTLDGGNAGTSIGARPTGGAIYNDGRLTVVDSTLINNSSFSGAAIYNAGTANISNSVFNNNGDPNSPHVVISVSTILNTFGTMTIENTAFENNRIINPDSSLRLIVNYLPSTLTIRTSEFLNNSIGVGNIISNYGNPNSPNIDSYVTTIEDTLFEGNDGQIALISHRSANLLVERSSFTNNQIGSIISVTESATINNSLFYGNEVNNVAYFGRENNLIPDELYFTNNTFSANTGNALSFSSTGFEVMIGNNIVDGGLTNSCMLNGLISTGYNVFSNDTLCNVGTANDIVNVPALVGSLQWVDGMPYTPLLDGSPALDLIPTCDVAVDLLGTERPINGNCDAGAYEIVSTPQSVTDVGISATYNVDTVTLNDAVVMTLTATNNGAIPATDISVMVEAPFTFQSATGSGTFTDSVWTLASIPAGESRTIDVTYLVDYDLRLNDLRFFGTLQNIAEADTDYSNNSFESDEFNTISTNYSIRSVYVNTENIYENAEFTATIRVNRLSISGDYIGAIVDLALPAGIEYITHTTNEGSYADGIWTIDNISNYFGSTTPSLTLTFRVAPNTPSQEIAWVFNLYNEQHPDLYTEDNIITRVLDVVEATDLSLTMTTQPNIAYVGDAVEFTFTATNLGTTTATNVNVYLSAHPTSFAPNSGTPNSFPLWQIGDLPAGETRTLTFTQTIQPEHDRQFLYMYGEIVSSTQDSNADNNVAWVLAPEYYVAVNPSDIEVTIDTNTQNVNVQDQVSYTVTVTNIGSLHVTDISLYIYSSGLVGVVGTGDFTQDNYEWVIESLPTGGVATHTFTGTVYRYADNASVGVDAHVQNNISEENMENNSAEYHFIVTNADLTLEFDPLPEGDINVGDQIDFVLHVSNAGPSVLESGEVPLGLPDGLTIQSTSEPLVDNLWTITNLGVGETATLTITADVGTELASYTRSISANGVYTTMNHDDNTAYLEFYVNGTDNHVRVWRENGSNIQRFYNVGEEYTLQVVVNSRGIPAETFSVQLDMPTGLTPINYGSSFDPATNTITDTVSEFGNTYDITFVVTEAAQGQALTVSATIAPATLPEPTLDNNVDSLTDYAIWATSQDVTVTTTTDDGNGLCEPTACTLRDALTDPRLLSGVNITIPAGTYVLTEGEITINRDATLIGDGEVIIDGNDASAIFTIYDGIPSTVNVSVVLQNLILQNAYGSYGGAITSYENLTILDSIIRNSRTSRNGGGIYHRTGTLEIHRSQIIDNIAEGNFSANGGGGVHIASGVNAIIADTTIARNNGHAGGGIYNSIDDVLIVRSTISDNTTSRDGGGLLTINSMTLISSTISGNISERHGGGISIIDANDEVIRIFSSTIVNNSANIGFGGGIYNADYNSVSSRFADVYLANSIVADNTAPSNYNRNVYQVHSQGYNLFSSLEDDSLLTEATTDIIANPQLDPLADNGGFTQTHLPLSTSPAIDAIPDCTGFDQQNRQRPIGAGCDIGAVEVEPGFDTPAPFVTSLYVINDDQRRLVDDNFETRPFTTLDVVFNQPMVNADDINNYLIIRAGADNILQTATCTSVEGDDVNITIQGVSYTDNTTTLTANFVDDNFYHVIACDTLQSTAGRSFTSDQALVVDVQIPLTTGPFTVNIAEDTLNDDVCSARHCSLRDAILAANANPGQDTIAFDLPANAVIQPTSLLPEITDSVIIDGWTQPGYTDVPIVVIDGSLAGNSDRYFPDHHGLNLSGGNNTVRGLVINNFDGAGLYFHANGGNTVIGNYLGIDVAGAVAEGNYHGLYINDVDNNQIGGVSAQDRNLISGNRQNGAYITGNNQVIEGNFIGTDTVGTAAISITNYRGIGLFVRGDNIRIGGINPTPETACSGACNLIAGNLGDHSLQVFNASNVAIQGNFIGYDVQGLNVLSSPSIELQYVTGDFLFGGNAIQERNLVSALLFVLSEIEIRGNLFSVNLAGAIAPANSSLQLRSAGQILLSDNQLPRISWNSAANPLIVENNYIGVTLDGTVFSHSAQSVDVRSGSLILRNNVIAKHLRIPITSLMENNWIGAMPNGSPLPMEFSHLIFIWGTRDSVSQTANIRNNVIANGTGYGFFSTLIPDAYSPENSDIIDLSQNSIYNMGGLSLFLNREAYCPECTSGALTYQVLPNDPFDLDTGVNGAQNYPVITGATTNGNTLTLTGLLHSHPSEAYRVEFFANTTCNASGYGDGERYIGTLNVNTNTAGDAPLNMVINDNIATGTFITATATGTEGTSGFSACFAVNDQPLTTAPSSISATTVSTTQVDLDWSSGSAGVTGYEVERSADGTTRWEHIITTDASTTIFSDTVALCGQAYYRVRAVYGNDYSPYTTTRADAETQPCTELELGVISQYPDRIIIGWEDIGATTYTLDVSPDGGSNWETLISTNEFSYTHRDLTCESGVVYRLTATGGQFVPEGGLSTQLAVNVEALCPPTNLIASNATETTITLTWQNQSNAENGYIIERSDDGFVWDQLATVADVTYIDTDLICVYDYHYRVRAVNTSTSRYSAYSDVLMTSPVTCDVTDMIVQTTTPNVDVLVSEQAIYTFTVSNNGPTTVNNAVVTLTIPAEFVVESMNFTCNNGVCDLGTIASGASVDLVITGRIDTALLVEIGASVDSEVLDITPNNSTSITINAYMPALTLLEPTGVITTPYGDPQFVWLDSGASAYELYLARFNDTSTTLVMQQVINDTICAYAICSIDLTTLDETYRLTNGAHQWYVRESGGAWVGPMNFTLNAPLPGLVTLETTTNLDDLSPTLNWSLAGDAVNATYFNLYLANASGSAMFNQWFTRAETCGDVNGTTCSLPSPVALTNGTSYDLYVRSYGPGGLSVGGPFNNGYQGVETFTVNVPVPDQIAPIGNVDFPAGNPMFTWSDVEGAEYYYLYVGNSSGAQIINEVVADVGYCNGTTCQLDATTLRENYRLPNGTYTWYIRAWRNDQATPWSAGESFTINIALPSVVTKVFPLEGEDTDYDMQFRWNQVANVTGYNLYLVNPNGANSGILAGEVDDEVTCQNGECSWNQVLDQIPGMWTWYISAFNAAGTGTWSSATTFTAPTAIPSVVNAISPTANQALTDSIITFEWQADENASRYELYMTGPGGFVHYQPYEVGQGVNCTTTCSLDLLAPSTGNYTWYVRAESDAGWGAWNTGITFSVTDTMPQPVTKNTPALNASLNDVNVAFSWTHDAEATVYEVYITGPNSYVNYNPYTVGTDVTCSTNCDLLLTMPANGAYTWYLRAGNAGGWTAWDTGTAFAIGQTLPSIVGKIAPTSNANLVAVDVNFSWTHDEAASVYEIYITGPNSFVHYEPYTVGSDMTCSTNCDLSLTMPENGAYTWYIRAGNDAGWSAWDSAAGTHFTIGQPLPSVITKITPAPNAIVTALDVNVSWTHDAQATVYEIYITGPNGYVNYNSYTVGSDVTCATNCELSLTMPENGAYTWYIRGGNGGGWGAWDAGTAFTMSIPAPSAPMLNSPADDAVIYQTNRPTFAWAEVSTATYYNLQLNNGMGAIAYEAWHESVNICNAGTCSLQVPNPLAFGGYDWRVQAYNSAGVGAWSTSRGFLSLSINLQPLMVQVEDGRISRTGTWTQQTSEGAVGATYLQSTASTADTLTMTFTGTQVDVVYVAGPRYGSFVIEIDGEPLRGVDANTTQLAFGQVASFSGLAEGEHTLRIVPLGGAPVAIDALVVGGEVLTTTATETPTPVVIPIEPIVTEDVIIVPEETPAIVPIETTPTEEAVVITPLPTENPPEATDALAPEVTPEP